MARTYPHLRFSREEPVTERRPSPPPRQEPPADPAAHGQTLLKNLQDNRQTPEEEPGFDDRRLFKIEVANGFDLKELEKIPGVEMVSQEEKTVVLAFASEKALDEFEALLSTLARGDKPKRKKLLHALKGFDQWTPENRTGWALGRYGLPEQPAPFLIDVELWPVGREQDRQELVEYFEQWLKDRDIVWSDRIHQPGLMMYRVRTDETGLDRLLRLRDVRTVDLPPRVGLERSLLSTDIQDLPKAPTPPDNAPGVVVLDSGLNTGHPLLAPAVGDSQDFRATGGDPSDEHGHGTHVAGIAVYGDVEDRLRQGSFVPGIRLFSGRILDRNNEADPEFVENHVEKAVRYFHETYGCRIFNLSYGDTNKPYRGGHVRGLAYTLDSLSRELGILFVVPTGNFAGDEDGPTDWLKEYPNYLLSETARLIDPAPALNALTVGSIARWDQSFPSQQYPESLEDFPIARRNQLSPFTRSGPSVGGAIKPELVAYGGNRAVNRHGYPVTRGLGELSLHRDSAAGRLFAEDIGTSFAAPHVTHLAARLLAEIPEASNNLLRAMLVAHARVPDEARTLIDDEENSRRLCGYGQIQPAALVQSLDDSVTLITEDQIPNKCHHFFELPIPENFWEGGRKRTREWTVALAHTPAVRTTRVDYRASRIFFQLVLATNLDEVASTFNKATLRDEFPGLREYASKRDLTSTSRGKGTVQASTWTIRQPGKNLKNQRIFIVVTRNDPPWGELLSSEKEPYALVVTMRERSDQTSTLYSRIQERLRVRERIRLRR